MSSRGSDTPFVGHVVVKDTMSLFVFSVFRVESDTKEEEDPPRGNDEDPPRGNDASRELVVTVDPSRRQFRGNF